MSGGLQESLRKDCFFQGPFAASGSASPWVLVRARGFAAGCRLVRQPRRNRQGRGACHWLPGGGAFCLLVHPGALGQEGENFRLEDGREAFGARREAPRAFLWSAAKTTRTAQPRPPRHRGERPTGGPRPARVPAGGLASDLGYEEAEGLAAAIQALPGF